ncbi:MAG TPA: universal stress protein [Candidatus Binatia bacterium]|nr:universal stress protein [Candidatus Binatia bacterium]
MRPSDDRDAGGPSERQLEVWEAFARDVIREQRRDVADRIARIVVPTDFSVCSMRALQRAEALAQRLGAEVVLVHVDPSVVLGSEVAPARQDAVRRELDGIAAVLGTRGVRARGVVRAGAPAEEILAVAMAEGADLIVMGTHGRTGLAHALLGSVAEDVVRRALCPVLTVRDGTT